MQIYISIIAKLYVKKQIVHNTPKTIQYSTGLALKHPQY